ncbi:MAG: deoxyribose-phosphate aldolase [Chlorobi bacterium]|nr:deoxyribose-phosphate aldolase [Chlorobiota bacterium]
MDIKELLSLYKTEIVNSEIEKEVKKITGNISAIYTVKTLKTIFGLIDLTTLNNTDTPETAKQFAENVNNFKTHFPDMPNVAAICVYPTLVEYVKTNLNTPGVKITSAAGGFPSSQTFIDLKIEEVKRAVEKGADEIDTVISAGTLLSGDFQTVYEEIKAIKTVCADKYLKVILESGSLENLNNVKIASILAIEAGADFLKTSTEKTIPASTLEATFVMSLVIKEYFERTGKKIGIKPAGCIADSETALKYFLLIKNVLGDDWITPEYFRIGTNKLPNKLLNDISKMSSERKEEIIYF